jgi:hypothetical protein
MSDGTRLKSLSDDDYTWLMRQARTNGPDLPEESVRYTKLAEQLHAVVVRCLGHTVTHVLLREDHSGEAGHGTPWNPHPTPQEAVQAITDLAAIGAAGYVAEEMNWRYARLPERNLVGEMAGRLHQAMTLAGSLSVEARTTLFAFAAGRSLIERSAAVVDHGAEQAKSTLRKNWPSVERLANLLLAHRRVEGAELERILSTATIPMPPHTE